MLTQSSTIAGTIQRGLNTRLSHANFHLKARLKSGDNFIVINSQSIYDKYWDLMKSVAIENTLSDMDALKYRFQPKLLSYDLYGTTELWSAILKLNNCIGALEFNFSKVKVFNDNIFDLLNEILILEEREIIRNNQNITSEVIE